MHGGRGTTSRFVLIKHVGAECIGTVQSSPYSHGGEAPTPRILLIAHGGKDQDRERNTVGENPGVIYF